MDRIVKINAGANCYLLKQDNSAILVDTGLSGNEKKILKACKAEQVKLIVLTHGHIDHIQNAAFLTEQLQIPIAMSRKDLDLIKDNLCREMKTEGFLGHLIVFFSKLSAKKSKVKYFYPDVFLEEGDNLSQYGVDIDIVELPGHTEGSIGLKFGNSIIVGDALMNFFRPSVALLYENRDAMLKSSEKITDLGMLQVYFGHGKSVNNRRWLK